GVLKPIVQASYLYSRDPAQCLEVIRGIISDPRSRPEDKSAAFHLWGLVLLDREDFDGARVKFHQAIELNQSHPLKTQRTRATVSLNIGNSYLWQQRWRDAAAAYQKAISLDEGWAVPYFYLGEARLGGGDLEGAIRQYRQALSHDPLYVEAWNAIGRTYMQQGLYEEAVDAYSKALRVHLREDQAAAFSYYGLGDALFRLGCCSAAAEKYDRAVAIDPSVQDQEARYDWAPAQACQAPVSADAAIVYPWRPAQATAAHSDVACVQADAHTLASAAGSVSPSAG